MSYYLIGIGGTGAKCLEAFVHLCGAGLLKDSQPVKIMYVDADVSCGNLTRTQSAADCYSKAQSIGFSDTGIFKNAIETFSPWSPIGGEGCSNLDDVFQRDSLVNKSEYKALGLLYDALFTEQERKTPLDKGFRGHPAIGAAVMGQSMTSESTEQWKSIEQQIDSDKDARIFLFASVFGGTGAAGFPTIAKILKNNLKKDEEGNLHAKIGGALILPYFQFPPAPTEEESEMQAKVADFMLNTKSALKYYDENGLLGSVFTKIYLMGDNDLTSMKEFSLGSNSQKNDAHFIELYAALAAFDFFNKADFDDKADTPMIARGDDTEETIDKITWDDIPNVCASGNVKDKLAAYARFLYAYRNCILLSLEKCAAAESEKRSVAWYKDLVEKAGRIDVYNDRYVMESFRALGDYAEKFFSWWQQIIQGNDKRNVELLNKQLLNANIWQNDTKLDIYQVVLPVTERKDKLTYKAFWNGLCKHTSKLKSTNDSGSEILMRAAYELCKQ